MKSAVRKSKCHQLIGIFVLGFSLSISNAYAEKTKKPKLPKSYESKVAPPEITDADRMFIDLREAAKKNDVFRTQQLAEG
jgi:soluble lytic murein transglycosylase